MFDIFFDFNKFEFYLQVFCLQYQIS